MEACRICFEEKGRLKRFCDCKSAVEHESCVLKALIVKGYGEPKCSVCLRSYSIRYRLNLLKLLLYEYGHIFCYLVVNYILYTISEPIHFDIKTLLAMDFFIVFKILLFSFDTLIFSKLYTSKLEKRASLLNALLDIALNLSIRLLLLTVAFKFDVINLYRSLVITESVLLLQQCSPPNVLAKHTYDIYIETEDS